MEVADSLADASGTESGARTLSTARVSEWVLVPLSTCFALPVRALTWLFG
jgi:hypothetical protein